MASLIVAVVVICLSVALLAVHRWTHIVTRVTCASFPSQAAAQMAYRSNPTDMRSLDADRDGVACESNRAPFDRAR